MLISSLGQKSFFCDMGTLKRMAKIWCKTIVTCDIKYGGYNSFAPSPQYPQIHLSHLRTTAVQFSLYRQNVNHVPPCDLKRSINHVPPCDLKRSINHVPPCDLSALSITYLPVT